jgi:hypothetical protein
MAYQYHQCSATMPYFVCHVHSMHHSSSVYFSWCTLPPSTFLNHSQQQHSSLLCSAFFSASSCFAILLLLLSIPHLLLISEFYLTLRILSVSHCTYCNFPFLTVQLIFFIKNYQPHTVTACFFLYSTTPSVTPQIPRKTL